MLYFSLSADVHPPGHLLPSPMYTALVRLVSPLVQTLLRSLQVPEPEEEPVEAEGLEAGVLDVVETLAVTETLSGTLAGAETAGAELAGAGLEEDTLLGSHLPPAQIAAQSRS